MRKYATATKSHNQSVLLDVIGVFHHLQFFYLLQRAVDVLRAPVGGQGVDGCQELVNVLF